MTCKFFYYRKGKCANEIPYDQSSSLCKLRGKFLCDKGVDDHNEDPIKGGEDNMSFKLSHSSKQAFIKCRRSFYYSKIKRISVLPHMLSLPVKLGAIWDKYINSTYSGVKFQDEFWSLVDLYQLDDMDVSRIFAIIQAHRTIGIQPSFETEDGGIFRGCQHPFTIIEDGDFEITGFIDRAYSDFIVETKLTGRPDFYFQIHNLSSQVGTYFLSNPDYKYCIIESVRVPGLRTGSGKFSDESSDGYRERTKSEIISRPSHYFLGFDRKTLKYGKRFWRNEFNFDDLKAEYFYVNEQIKECLENGTEGIFYKNRNGCYVPGPCQYLPICENGSVSEQIYTTKETIQKEVEIETSDGE